MRYCFRHSDANWYATLRVLLALFLVIAVWVIVAGLAGDRYINQPAAAAPVAAASNQSMGGYGQPLQIAQTPSRANVDESGQPIGEPAPPPATGAAGV